MGVHADRNVVSDGLAHGDEALAAQIDQPLLISQRCPPGYTVERVALECAVALRHELFGKRAKALRRAVPNGTVEGSVYRYGFPDSATEQRIDRNVQRFSLKIPHGDIDARCCRRRDKAASTGGDRAVVLQNVFPYKFAPQIVDGGHHFKLQPVERCVTEAQNALVGLGNDKHVVRVDGSVYHLCSDVCDPHGFSPFQFREYEECLTSVGRIILWL